MSQTPENVVEDARSSRLRKIGIGILAVGLASAAAVYFLQAPASPFDKDPTMAGYNKSNTRQMGVMYGQMGILIEDLTADLKRPGVQAAIIAGGSVVAALVCFYFAQPPPASEEPPPT